MSIITDVNKIDKACITFKNVNKSKIDKFNKLDTWLYKESNIFNNEVKLNKNNFTKHYPKFKRGQIIKVDFGINIGSELSHTHFAIVLNSDDTIKNDNITVIPITSKIGYKKIYLGKILKEAMPKTPTYNLNCYAYITQIKTISKRRKFNINIKYICNNDILNKIDKETINYLTSNTKKVIT